MPRLMVSQHRVGLCVFISAASYQTFAHKNRWSALTAHSNPNIKLSDQFLFWETVLIAVIVPAHNEEDEIKACLASIAMAARCRQLEKEQVVTFVVLDDCTDNTRSVAQEMGVTVIGTRVNNVGAARALGAQLALAAGARWLAFTDADTQVASDWLSAQLAQSADAVCGTVAVKDWGTYGQKMRTHYDNTYNDRDGHRHIHGANLGVSAQAYVLAGGFQNLESSEDVALVKALEASSALIAWSAAPRVWTSSRRNYRAPGGFGETLARVERESSVRQPDTTSA